MSTMKAPKSSATPAGPTGFDAEALDAAAPATTKSPIPTTARSHAATYRPGAGAALQAEDAGSGRAVGRGGRGPIRGGGDRGLVPLEAVALPADHVEVRPDPAGSVLPGPRGWDRARSLVGALAHRSGVPRTG